LNSGESLLVMVMYSRGLAAVWDADQQRMTVFGITKVPFFNRSMLAAMLDLALSSVVMNVADAGGGFGVRGDFYPEDYLVPALARRLNRPVKWIEDRREHFLAANHSRETPCDPEIACDRDGIIVGLRGEVTIDIGACVRGTGGTPPTRCAQFVPGPYRIPNFACKVNAYISNKTPSGTYRGPLCVEQDHETFISSGVSRGFVLSRFCFSGRCRGVFRTPPSRSWSGLRLVAPPIFWPASSQMSYGPHGTARW
jgi:hypothetical protein